ncbi:hypothetical protein [Mycolicibacterium gilvum]|uniref:Lipoprotein n=1 Tax=Mycolicibacterium gilvum TaxID=1804 RepID=A0A378SHJ6_9MYCO|nr:hypothetical protein [Mycolicibacterium gilvum]MCV7057178.1 hypothetical protein [Mycolicibacterium gilvum]STZ42312.1 Uncharacterised protein [Mycolicibacterium gilvum]
MAHRFTALLFGVALALTACQGQPASEDGFTDTSATTSRPAPEIRHDTEELAVTFPALGTPVSASWITWDNSGGSEPSRLSLRWIDAVVRVSPETMTGLVDRYHAEDVGNRPAVQKVLEPELPPGPFLTGVELNMFFGGPRRSTRVFLDPPRDTVVLQSSVAGRA